MNKQFIRRVALAIIALLAFAQASVALAACSMERGGMAQMMTSGDDCCGAPEVKTPDPQLANGCVAHCTADLQLSALPVALVQSPADTPVLLLPHPHRAWQWPALLNAPPPRAIPSRILLHSFLI